MKSTTRTTGSLFPLLGVMFMLSACASQAPAPVESGYSDNRNAVAWDDEGSSVLDNYTASYVENIVQNYYVQQGDTPASIASRYDVSTEALLQENSLTPNSTLYVGQRLSIPSGEVAITNNDVASSNAPQQERYSLTRGKVMAQEPASEKEELENQAMLAASEVIGAPKKPEAVAPQKPQAKTGITHVVQPGENIFRIGLTYGVSQFDIMAVNDIDRPESLVVGKELKIPVKGQVDTASIQPAKLVKKETGSTYIAAKYRNAKGLIWPAEGRVVKKFGVEGEGVNNTGINISVPMNAPVMAAESGKVIYSDDGLKSYGNLILIRHSNGLVTAYGHNSKNLVQRNEQVQKGQVIAHAGTSGGVDSPQLHFEVRKNARAVNPLSVLPK